jgi:hypothetical protein
LIGFPLVIRLDIAEMESPNSVAASVHDGHVLPVVLLMTDLMPNPKQTDFK